MSTKKLTMMATGELMLTMEDDPEFYFDLVAPALKSADLVIGHLEVPHTKRPAPTAEMMLPAPDPDNLRGLLAGNFSAVTLAGNPTFSYGAPGIIDTVEWLNEHNIGHVGAGMNIEEARRPLIIERDGTRFGFLSYDLVGGKNNAATHFKPGAAYVDILTHYEPARFPGSPPQIYTFAERWSLEAMREDIRALRPQCDVLSVALHMGIGMVEAVLADYETEVSRAAIDAGADIVLGSHCHILKGVQFYKGKAIFHCTGNLVTVFPWQAHNMFKEEPDSTLLKSKIRARAGRGRSFLDLDYPNYPFPAQSRKSIIVKCSVEGGKISRISYLPCLVNQKGQPEILKHDERGQEVFDYLEKITRAAGFTTRFEWDGDEVVVHDE